MPPADVLEIVAAIADALDYAHERYLLHRDVKPANILLTDPRGGDRRILLADFGIARASNEAGGLTATNMTVGSVAYAAPEQLTGRPLDGSADQYALACTAYHLFTGGPPFGNSSPAVVIGSHLSQPPPTLETARADLAAFDSVLAKALAKEPYRRFGSCREFAAALAGGGTGLTGYADATQAAVPIPAALPPIQVAASDTARLDASRTPRLAVLIAAGVAALVVVGLVAFVGARLAQPDSELPTAAPTSPTLVQPEPTMGPSRPPRTVTQTRPPVTVTQAAPSARVPTGGSSPSRPPGDLGLARPMSSPDCNGQGIVILGNVTTPGQYEAGIQRLLNQHPGASYLRTDQSCPSLRQASDEGNPIYAVYRTAGTTTGQVCGAVRSAGGDAYGKWLDTTTDPAYMIEC
jgi:serine/threonine-protein kinase